MSEAVGSINCLFLAPGYRLNDPRNAGKLIPILHSLGWSIDYVGGTGESDYDVDHYIRSTTDTGRVRRWSRFFLVPRLLKEVRRTQPTVVLSVGIDAWVSALVAKLLSNGRVKIVADLPEDFSAIIEKWSSIRAVKAVLSWLTDGIIRYMVRWTDLTIVSRRQLAQRYDLERFAVFYNPSNTGGPIVDRTFVPVRDTLKLVHLGIMGSERGSLILPAVLRQLASYYQVECTLIGRFYDDTWRLLRDSVLDDPRVTITLISWMPYRSALELASEHDVGLVLFQPRTENLVNAMPNKIFDYALCGLPFVAPSWAPELRDLVELAGFGTLCDTTNADEIASEVISLVKDPDRYIEQSLAGRLSVQAGGPWSFGTLSRELREKLASLAG